MNPTKYGITFVSILAITASAHGHGVQIQITHDPSTGRIETREIVHTDTRPSTISSAKRVYVMPLMPLVGGAGDGWYTRPDTTLNIFGIPMHPTGAGLTYQYDEAGQLPGTGWAYTGSSTLPNLENTQFGYQFSAGLQAWNGGAFTDAGTEELQAFRGDGTSVPTITATTSDSGPFASLPMSNIATKSGNAHHSVGFRLLGDGITPGLSGAAAGDDGIYLAAMTLTSSASNVLDSELFYFVMHKNVNVAEALAAAETLGFAPSLIQVVPEPASMGLMLCSAGVFLFSRRRRI